MGIERPRNGCSVIKHNQFSLVANATAVIIVPALTGQTSRMKCTVINTDATNTLFVGNAGVTGATGFPIGPGASKDINFIGALYAFSANNIAGAYMTEED